MDRDKWVVTPGSENTIIRAFKKMLSSYYICCIYSKKLLLGYTCIVRSGKCGLEKGV